MPTLALIVDASRARKGARDFQRASSGIRKAASSAAAGMRNMQMRMNSLGSSTSLLRGTLGKLVTGFVAFKVVSDAIRVLSKFEETMAALRGVAIRTNLTLEEQGEQFESLSAKARELGATTRFTAADAAQGMLNLARAGFTANEAIAAIPATLNLAVGGMIGLGEASEFTANAIRQFGLEASEAERVADVFLQTSNRANTTVTELAQAMKFVGPVAGALGISMENAAAAIGVLGDSGIKATMAGTALRGVFAALLQSTPKAEKALDTLGLTIEDLDPTMQSVDEIFRKFADASLTAGQAVAIFGRRNAAAALVMTRNASKIEELTQTNKEARGEAQRMADLVDDTLIGSFKALRSSIEELFISTGEQGLAKGLRDLVDSATLVIRSLSGMDIGTSKAARQAEIFANNLKAIGSAIGTLGPAVLALGISIKVLGRAMVGLTLSNPFGVLVLGVVTAMAAVKLFVENTDVFGKRFKVTWSEVITGTIDATIQALRALTGDQGLKTSFEILEEQGKKRTDALNNAIDRLNFAQSALERARVREAPVKIDLSAAEAELAGLEKRQEELIEKVREGISDPIESGAAGRQLSILFDQIQAAREPVSNLQTQMAFLASSTSIAEKEFEKASIAFEKFKKTVSKPDELAKAQAAFDKASEAQQKAALDALKAQREIELVTGDGVAEPLADDNKFIARITKNRDALRAFLEEQKKLSDALLKTDKESRDQASKQLDSMLQRIEAETSMVGLSADAKRRAAFETRALAVAEEAFGKGSSFAQGKVIILTAALEKLQATQAKFEGRKAIQEMNDSLDRQQLLLGMTADEQERYNTLIGLGPELLKAFGGNVDAANIQMEQFNRELKRIQEAEKLVEIGKAIGTEFGNALQGLVFDAKNFEESIQDMLVALGKLVFQMLITKAISEALGAAFSGLAGGGGSPFVAQGGAIPDVIPNAKGNLFDRTGVKALANGGLLSQPTFLPLAGEAGPEFIMPAARTSTGELGVRAIGGGTSTKTVNVNINVEATDMGSFRRSEQQLASSAARIVRRID